MKRNLSRRASKFSYFGSYGKRYLRTALLCQRSVRNDGSQDCCFEQEYFPEDELIYEELPYTVELEDGMYIVEGPKIEKMLGYTNLDSEKGFAFFQKFLKETGILDELEAKGIQEGDTVKMYGLQFDYYK